MTIKMASARSLDGLIKWLTRDEWDSSFGEILDHHFTPACDKAGIEVDEAVSLLGQDWFLTTVWGSAFEDFLTREVADGRNIVDDYLKRRGWKESASAKAYMRALRNSVISLYEVSNVVLDTSFLARDLVRGGEPVLISERAATRSLKQWDRIAARVVTLGSQTVISGALLPFSQEASEQLLKILHSTSKRAIQEKHKLADLIKCDPDHPSITNAISDSALLQVAAPAVTTVWLTDILDRMMNPGTLEVCNTDGDELLFCSIHFPFMQTTRPSDIRLALNELPDLRQETETFWNWISCQDSASTSRTKGKSEHRQLKMLTTTLDDGSIVLGNIELKDRSLILSVNSQPRAERGRAYISERLGTLVTQPLTEMQTLDQIKSTQPIRPTPPPLDLSPEERRTIIHDSLDKHYMQMISDPIPMLGNKSPRSAAKTTDGRTKVGAWLKTLENHSAKFQDRSNPMATYDFSWLWAELNVSDQRR